MITASRWICMTLVFIVALYQVQCLTLREWAWCVQCCKVVHCLISSVNVYGWWAFELVLHNMVAKSHYWKAVLCQKIYIHVKFADVILEVWWCEPLYNTDHCSQFLASFLIFCQKFPMVFPEPDHTFILFLLQFLYRPFTKMPPCCDFFFSSLYFLSSVMSISLLHFIKLVNKFTLESATDKVCSVCFIRPWCGKAWLTAMRFLTLNID